MLFGPLLYPTVVDAFYADPTAALAKTTRANWRYTYKGLQAAHLGKRINQFTEDDVLGYVLRAGVSKSTQLANRTAILALFGWALEEGLIDKDPCTLVKRRTKKLKADRVRLGNWLDADELTAILDTCAAGDPVSVRDRIVLLLGFSTGLRVAEIARMRWRPASGEVPDHVDLAAKVVVTKGKGGKLAEVPMSNQLLEALLEWRGRCAQGLGRPVAADPVIPWVLRLHGLPGQRPSQMVTYWHKPLGVGGLGEVVRRRGILIGRDTLAPHDMRRTLAGQLEAKGMPYETISKILRHENVTTTQKYLERNPLKLRGVMGDFAIGS